MPSYHLVAGNLIEHNEKYVLVQEGKEHVKGQWNVPAGSIEKKEQAKKAAVREAKEETGLNVDIEGLIGVYFDQSDYMDGTVVIFVFHSKISEKDFKIQAKEDEEILDTGMFSKQQIKDKEIRTPFVLDAIQTLESGKISSIETVKDYL